jgi:hypothetical protein
MREAWEKAWTRHLSRIWGGAGIDRIGLADYQTLRRNGLVIELSSLLNTVAGTKRV